MLVWRKVSGRDALYSIGPDYRHEARCLQVVSGALWEQPLNHVGILPSRGVEILPC